MKKLFVVSVLALAISACGRSSNTADNDDDTTTVADRTEVVAPDTPPPAVDEPYPEEPSSLEKESVPPPPPVAKAKPAVVKPQPAGSAKGGALIKASDCLSCHREDIKLVGPAYKDVAVKYKATDANITMLADKIIAGGSGNWGQIPMTPHPAVSKADAKEMVKYILAVK